MKLLHLDSSIQGEGSVTRAISAAVANQFQGADVTYRDLAAAELPHITLAGFATENAQAVMQEFKDADVVVIGAPMYNFTIPTQLKAWIDHIVVAGQTFQYGANGAEGLAGGKRVIIALARGGVYSGESPAAAMEHAETYLRDVFGFIGITDVEFITAEGVAFGPEHREAAVSAAHAKAEALVREAA